MDDDSATEFETLAEMLLLGWSIKTDNINISSMAAAKSMPRGMRLPTYCGITTRRGF